MINSYKALRDLFSEKLNGNATETLFDVSLYNSDKTKYTQDFNEDDGVTVTTKRIVPTNIVEIVGNYINIPNTSVTENAIALEFDIFVGDYDSLPYDRQTEFKSVDYYNTLASIENMRKDLLAKYYQLGNVGLYFGGTDSVANFQYGSGFEWNTIYLKADIKNNDTETILLSQGGSFDITLKKQGVVIELDINGNVLSVPFTLGLNEIYAYYQVISGVIGRWTLSVDGNVDTYDGAVIQTSPTSGFISPTQNFEGIVYELHIGNETITSADISNLNSAEILFNDFDSRYVLTNNGSIALTDESIDDCILWGDDGNAVFSFETLVPISEIDFGKDGAPYQSFGLSIGALVSNDIVYGNSFEYFLDGNQIYPVDRQHTYGTEQDGAQYINDYFAKSVAQSNAKDMTQSFFYTPSKQITQLLKQVTGNVEEQNKVYRLVVQYPFHKVTYDVIIDSGGASGNINELSTITLTYKQKDDAIS